MPERLIENRITNCEGIYRAVSRYVYASNFVTGKVVLDVACGEGYGTEYLGKKGTTIIAGGDVSYEAIKYAQHHHNLSNSHFMILDAERLPFTHKSFDTVVSLETIEHLKNPKRFLEECKSVLKPEGLLVLSTPDKDSRFFLIRLLMKSEKITAILRKLPLLSTLLISAYHLHEFGRKELISAVEDHFSIEHSLGLYCVEYREKLRKYRSRRLRTVLCEMWKLSRFVKRRLLGRCPCCKLSSLPKDFETLSFSNHFVIDSLDKEPNFCENIILVGKAKRD